MAYTERYCTVAGAGAHDGTSEANAWTLEEAIAAAITGGGFRINVKAGTHTPTASRTFTGGVTENPNEWRGYNSTIGDLETVGRDSASGALTVTNFPLVDCTSTFVLTCGTHTILKNISMTAVANAITLSSGAAYTVWRCKIANTHATGAAASAFLNATNYGALSDCDCLIASNHASAIIVDNGRGSIVGCRVWNSATPASTQVAINSGGLGGTVVGCVIFHVGIAIGVVDYPGVVVGNSWYDVTTGIRFSGATSTCVANNVGWLRAHPPPTSSAGEGAWPAMNPANHSAVLLRKIARSMRLATRRANAASLHGLCRRSRSVVRSLSITIFWPMVSGLAFGTGGLLLCWGVGCAAHRAADCAQNVAEGGEDRDGVVSARASVDDTAHLIRCRSASMAAVAARSIARSIFLASGA